MSRGYDLLSKGYKIFKLTHYEGRIYSYMPDSVKKWIKQKIRWNENNIIYGFQKKEARRIIKFIIASLFSIYLLIFPVFILFHISFVLLGIFIILNLYLIKIRRLFFYKRSMPKKYRDKYGFIFFFKILFYIYVEIIVHFYILVEILLFGGNKLKKRKNL